MKMRLIMAAVIAAFFMLPIFGLTAYAVPADISETPVVAEETPAPEISEAADAPGAAVLPALPPGVATVIDFNTDPDGRLFYTIMTPDEHVFYLVIDKTGNTDNVYFLNAVTLADLAALAEMPAQNPSGAVIPPPPSTTEPPTETPPPAEQPQSGGNMGMYIIVGLLVIVGGGAGWYFKIYRPKQQGGISGGEYDPSMDEAENDYADDWGADTDEADEGDDSPPWETSSYDEDGGESGDNEDE